MAIEKFTVTLADLRKSGACYSGYNKVVRALQVRPFTADDAERESYILYAHKDPVTIESIFESNGVDDALWALRCVKDNDRDLRLYAVWCARQVEHLMTDKRSKNALDISERFANGDATEKDLNAARAAAGDAEWAAAWDAAGAAAGAAQKEMLIKMCKGEAPWQLK